MENDIRRKRSMDGTLSRLRQGQWCGVAPIGYQWVDKKIEIHPKNGPLVRKAFLLKYENPELCAEEIKQIMGREGLKTGKNTMYRVLRNPFYCGLVAHRSLKGEVIQGVHKPLISHEVFLAVNQVMQKTHPVGWKIKGKNELLPLKRFLYCENCGQKLTGYVVKKRKGKDRKTELPYYKCRTKGCPTSINAKKVAETFREFLDNFSTDPKYIPLIARELRFFLEDQNEEHAQAAERMNNQLQEVKGRLNRLRKRYVLLEEISRTDYEEFAAQLKGEKREIEQALAKLQNKKSNHLHRLEECLKICVNLVKRWDNGDYQVRQRLQNLVFPEGASYSKEKNKVLTTRTNSIFALSAQMSKILSKKRKGKTRVGNGLPHWVPPKLEASNHLWDDFEAVLRELGRGDG